MSKRPGDVILLHICTINHDHMMYGSQDIKCKRQSFFVIMGHILPFDSPNWKNQNFEKKISIYISGALVQQKYTLYISGDIIILRKCTKTHDHRLYCSWDMVRGRCNCCISFWAIFCYFTALTAQKMKNLKKKMKKTPGDIIILHKCTKNHDHMPHCSWDMARDIYNCYFSFWAIFCPFTAQKIKISKKWK